jgi:exopolysaccharide biosynthesis polyprenyl glycosylphosphotransferase
VLRSKQSAEQPWQGLRLEGEPLAAGAHGHIGLAPELAPARSIREANRLGRTVRLRRIMLLADVIALNAVLVAAQMLGELSGGSATAGGHLILVVLGLPLWVVLAGALDAYEAAASRPDHTTAEEAGRILQLTTMWSWALLFCAWVLGLVGAVEIGAVATFWGLAAVLVLAGRAVARAWCRRRIWYWQNVLVVGRPEEATPAVRRMIRNPAFGMHVVACIDITQQGRFSRSDRQWIDHVPVVAESPSLGEVVRTIGVDRVVLAGDMSSATSERHLRELAELDVQVDILPSFAARFGRIQVHDVGGMPTWTVGRSSCGRHSLAVKRLIDMVGSAVALIALAPIMLVCAIAIKLGSPGPVLFRQLRVGKDDGRFEVFKFRSMYIDAERRKEEFAALNFHGGGNNVGMFKIRDDPRISRVGRFLRRTSLDELPQLINVLRGEMSLVGPRPLIENEDRQIDAEYRRPRTSVKPGVTGLWQVHGRSEVPFEEMVRLDCVYAMHWSLKSDITVLLRTLAAVVQGRGAY